MRRVVTRASQVAVDLVVLAIAYTLSFGLRFDWSLPPEMLRRLFWTLPIVMFVQYSAMLGFGVPRFAWRYVGLREARQIFAAFTASGMLLLLLRLASGNAPSSSWLASALIPTGVIVVMQVLAFLGIVGVRVLRRLTVEKAKQATHRSLRKSDPVATLLVGAGQFGVLAAKEIESRPDMGLFAVGFIDDDPLKLGSEIHGVRVLGNTEKLATIATESGAKQILVTIANATGTALKRITKQCEGIDLPVKIIPGLHEIVGGDINLSRIRNVAIEDLLRRDPISLDESAIANVVENRTVLVSGAGGSIGSEVCRQVCKFKPARLVLVERAENNLFNIHRELIAKFPELTITPAIADVCDRKRLEDVFQQYSPTTVFHAAAHKHVPMMEWNPGEAVKNNVGGTKTLADVSHENKVEVFVMISTDKAVNPTSVMGTTKRVAELYIQALSQRSPTRFVTVRFGNVLGSAGSVIPIFREQIAAGGPVTVTHPEMKRYFMTIPEATQLVLQAGTMGQGGEIFILDMGEPVKIVDLARDLIALSGLRLEEDIEIQFTGLRPGEKLFEELSVEEENADKTRHPKIFVGRIKPSSWETTHTQVRELLDDIDQTEPHIVRKRLGKIVPEYSPQEKPNGEAVKTIETPQTTKENKSPEPVMTHSSATEVVSTA